MVFGHSNRKESKTANLHTLTPDALNKMQTLPVPQRVAFVTHHLVTMFLK